MLPIPADRRHVVQKQEQRLKSDPDSNGDVRPVLESRPIVPSRGFTNSNAFLITPENWVVNALPHFEGTTVRPMATPRCTNAQFGQYLLDFEPSGGTSCPVGAGFEHFLYQLDGEIVVELDERVETIRPGGFCFLVAGTMFSVRAPGPLGARTLWTKRRYSPAEGLAAPTTDIFGRQEDVPDIIPDPPGQYVYRELIPTADRANDMAMNLMICEPGASLGQVEIHHQEHGLLMLSGQGIYYLAGKYYEVFKDDFIYMAPYCPQSFWTTGYETASYLLYKDVNRDGF
jgi:(S)-ureidoglycine aminohydrolase